MWNHQHRQNSEWRPPITPRRHTRNATPFGVVFLEPASAVSASGENLQVLRNRQRPCWYRRKSRLPVSSLEPFVFPNAGLCDRDLKTRTSVPVECVLARPARAKNIR